MIISSAEGIKHRRLFNHLKVQTPFASLKPVKSNQKTFHQKTKICVPDSSPAKITETQLEHGFEELFEKGKKLGQGAHSCVYEYTEVKTHKSFAVKVFKDCDCERIKGIKQSFILLSQLDHPSIVKAQSLYINEATARCYLVTEICYYKDLRCFIENQAHNGNVISEERVANILYKILNCLNYLKAKGICHRDIKPQNILYDSETESVKLIDFELSKMKKSDEELFQMWTYTGSIFYRAPESFAIGYSETIDMWAAGVVAFQLLTGSLPFASTSMKRVTEQILTKQIDFDSLEISKEAKSFLKQMLKKNPKRRAKPEQALNSKFILKNCSQTLNIGKFSKPEQERTQKLRKTNCKNLITDNKMKDILQQVNPYGRA